MSMQTVAQSQLSTAAAVFDLSRGRQALLSVAQPALGAVLAIGGLPSARVISLGLLAASTGYLAVFSLNDVLDRGSDESAADVVMVRGGDALFDIDTAFQRHPLARGALPVWFGWAWVGGLSVISVGASAALGLLCVAFFAAAAALEVLYCALRSVTWTKTFISGVMVGLGGLAGWVAVAPLSGGAAAFFVFLALWEIAGRNLPNDLADVVDDGRVGIRTVSTRFGHRVAGLAICGGAILTAFSTLALPGTAPFSAAAFLAVAGMMVVPGIRLADRPTSEAAARYFNVASLVPPIIFASAVLLLMIGG
ncbi:MAG: UbiA family prenyltransferase [Coriobacteriia bacterium]